MALYNCYKNQKVALLIILMLGVNLVSIQFLRENRSSFHSNVDSNELNFQEENQDSYNVQQAGVPNFVGYHNFFKEPFTIPEYLTYNPTYELADLDNDGNSDLFMIEGNDVKIYRNPGIPNASFDSWSVFNVSRGYPMQSALIFDVNGDGWKDIITSSAGKLYFFINDGNVWKNHWNSSSQSFVIYSSIDQITKILADDLEHDFDIDLVVISQNKTLFILEQYNSIIWSNASWRFYKSNISVERIVLSDINNDDYNDLVIITYSYLSIFINFKNISQWDYGNKTVVRTLLSGDYIDLEVADLDGNGQKEIVVCQSIIPNYNISIFYYTNGNPFAANWSYVSCLSTGFTYYVDLQDMDRDGFIELYFSCNGSFFVGNFANNFLLLKKLVNSIYYWPNFFIDFNLDGDLDMISMDSSAYYRWVYLISFPRLYNGNVSSRVVIFSRAVNYTVWIQYKGSYPTNVYVNIDGVKYQMQELNTLDTNFEDGKGYVYSTTQLPAMVPHFYSFSAEISNIINASGESAIRYGPEVYYMDRNPYDFDSDGFLDDEDLDDDNDGVPDSSDLFPKNSREWADNDLDGIGDNSDPDDDNDGVPDNFDKYPFDSSKNEVQKQIWEESWFNTAAILVGIVVLVLIFSIQIKRYTRSVESALMKKPSPEPESSAKQLAIPETRNTKAADKQQNAK